MPRSVDAIAARGSGSDPRRRFLSAAGLGALIAFIVFTVILQGGRDGLLGRDLLGNFYDGQARAILDGRLDVPPAVPGFEGFVIDGKTFIYQGLTPVLPRLPVVALTESTDGRLTGVSMLAGYAMLLAYVCAAAWRARLSIRGVQRVGWGEQVFTAVTVFGIGTGLVTFVASRAWVYHEAVMWAVALSLASLVHLLMWIEAQGGTPSAVIPVAMRTQRGSSETYRPGRPVVHAGLAAAFGGLAFNTRSSVGAGPLGALAITCTVVILGVLLETGPTGRAAGAFALWGRRLIDGLVPAGWEAGRTPRGVRRSNRTLLSGVALMLAGALLFTAAYAAVNHARFGSLFAVPLDKQRLVEVDPLRLDALDANDGSLFGLKYAPSVVTQLLRPDSIAPRSVFPYLGFPHTRPTVIGSVLFAERDWSTSIPLASPLGFLGAIAGLILLAIPRRVLIDDSSPTERPQVTAWRIPVAGGALGGVAVIAFGYMAQRYAIDFYPFLALSALLGLQLVARRLFDSTRETVGSALRVLTIGTVTVTALFGAWVTSAVALQYQREIAPGYASVNRPGWLGLQLQLPGRVTPRMVTDVESLAEGRHVGDVSIVGECRALYRWSGTRWFMLEAGGGPGGTETGFRLRVRSTIPFRSLGTPLVLMEGSDEEGPLQLELVGLGDSAELRFSRGIDEITGFPIPGDEEGFELDLDVTQDRLVDELIIRAHRGRRELLVSYTSSARVNWSAPAQHATGTVIELSPMATPLCDRLRRR